LGGFTKALSTCMKVLKVSGQPILQCWRARWICFPWRQMSNLKSYALDSMTLWWESKDLWRVQIWLFSGFF
jgi:hypothetical protein